MNLLAVRAGACTHIGRTAVLACLSLPLVGCNESPARRSTAGDDASPTLNDGGSTDAGSTAGASGDARSADATQNGGADGGGTGAPDSSVPDSGSAPRDAGITVDSGNAGDSAARVDSCVNVSGAGDQPWFDLTIAGTDFDADEGKRMRVVVATQNGNRVGLADLPIVKGAFTLTVPKVLNASWYVGVTLYVDRNDNDTCEPEEHAWDWATRIVVDNMYFEVTPDELCDHSLMGCRRRQPTRQACWVGSGETKLTEPLACVP